MGSKLNWFAVGVVTGLVAAAVGQELAKEPEARTWKGTVAGIPYNFRLEEWPEATNEYWNPESDKVLVPRAIGLGWGVNFAALKRRVESLLGVTAPVAADESAQQHTQPQTPLGV